MKKPDDIAVENGHKERTETEVKFSFRDLLQTASAASKPSPGLAEAAESASPPAKKNESSAEDQVIYELTDVVEEGSPKAITVAEFNGEIMKRVAEITERIAREMVPDIAERIIREEIEKLKATDEQASGSE